MGVLWVCYEGRWVYCGCVMKGGGYCGVLRGGGCIVGVL